MSISDHIAILTHAALAVPVPNKLKPAQPLEYYAVIAYPPTAANDLQAIALNAASAMFGGLNGVAVGVKRNQDFDKPLPGVPGEWFIVRAASKFAPEIYAADGVQLLQSTPDGQARIRQEFFAGKRVRVNLTAYAWTYGKDKKGVSFNLPGLMDAGEGGDRLPMGNDSASAFAKHANANAAPAQTIAQSPVAKVSAAAAAAASTAFDANPFAQVAPSPSNPFA